MALTRRPGRATRPTPSRRATSHLRTLVGYRPSPLSPVRLGRSSKYAATAFVFVSGEYIGSPVALRRRRSLVPAGIVFGHGTIIASDDRPHNRTRQARTTSTSFVCHCPSPIARHANKIGRTRVIARRTIFKSTYRILCSLEQNVSSSTHCRNAFDDSLKEDETGRSCLR